MALNGHNLPPLGLGDKLLLYLLVTCAAWWLLSPKALLIYGITSVAAILWRLLPRGDAPQHQRWRQLGIPDTGSLGPITDSIRLFRTGFHVFDSENLRRLGPMHSIRLLGRREVVTTDLEFLREVCLKKFLHFQNRMSFFENPQTPAEKKNIIRNVMSLLKGDVWKRVRNQITPAFTTGKMKKLFPQLNESTRLLCGVIDKFVTDKSGDQMLPLKELFGRFSLDVIARAGFSLDLDTYSTLLLQREKKKEAKDGKEKSKMVVETNPFILNSKLVFESGMLSWRGLLFTFCPALTSLISEWAGMNIVEHSSHIFFRDFLLQLYEERKEKKKNQHAAAAATEQVVDVFQLLMQAVEEEKDKTAIEEDSHQLDADIVHAELQQQPVMEEDAGNDGNSSSSSRKIRKGGGLSKMELLAQSMILLLAGHETSGSTLQFIAYALAAHPQVQEQLREEVLSVVGDSSEITYEHSTRMPYMNAVIMETLRLFPIAPRVDRECNSPVEIKGVPFGVGDLVALPVYAIQRDPRHYPEPERFDPKRFLPEAKASRDPMTFLAFGYGPRNCIGMRLAEFELRVAIATVLRKYRLCPASNALVFPPAVESNKIGLLKPVETLHVRAEKI